MFREELLYFIFPFLLTLWWIFVLRLVSFSGGWSLLAARYPLPYGLPGTGHQFKFQSLCLGLFTKYRHSINITIYDEGFELRTLLIYALFHKPLFIRWESVEEVELQGKTFRYLSFYLERKRFRIWGGSSEELYAMMIR